MHDNAVQDQRIVSLAPFSRTVTGDVKDAGDGENGHRISFDFELVDVFRQHDQRRRQFVRQLRPPNNARSRRILPLLPHGPVGRKSRLSERNGERVGSGSSDSGGGGSSDGADNCGGDDLSGNHDDFSVCDDRGMIFTVGKRFMVIVGGFGGDSGGARHCHIDDCCELRLE